MEHAQSLGVSAAWTADRHLRLLSATGEALKLLGMDPPSNHLGRPLMPLLRADDPQCLCHRSHLQALWGETAQYEHAADGRLFAIDVAPMHDVHRRIVGCLALCRERAGHAQATEAAFVEPELAHLARLSVASELASCLAHELTQPLTAIGNYAHGSLRHFERERYSTPSVIHAIEQIAAQADRAGEIIGRMRQFIRKGQTRRSSVDLNEVARDVVAMIEPESRQRATEIRLDLKPDLPQTIGDFVQLEQVLLNLVRNALDAVAPLPPPQRQVIVHTGSDHPAEVVVEVEDSGGGIAPDLAQRVFEPFFTTRPQGLGLGLTISQSIVQGHGGQLTLESSSGSGARLRVTLPATGHDETCDISA